MNYTMSQKVKKLIDEGNKYPQLSEEWFKKRHNIISATNVASIIDCNPNKSKYELFNEKASPLPPPPFSNDMTEWGHKYEPIARRIYEKISKDKVYECGLLIHPEYPWLGASPDGIRDCGWLLEIKCLYNRKQVTELPVYYWVQIQIQLQVTGMKMANLFQCKFIELKDEKEFEMATVGYTHKGCDTYKGEKFYWVLDDFGNKAIHRDDEWFYKQLPILKQFWSDFMKCRTAKITSLPSLPSKKRRRTRSSSNADLLDKYHDWSKWVSATETRNYMIRDPLLDWYNQYGREFGVIADNRISTKYDFNVYIKEQGVSFENAVVENIMKRFDKQWKTVATIYEAYSIEKAKESFQAMQQGVPIIFQAVIHNKDNMTYGIPDMIIRSDYINKLFEQQILTKEEETVRASNLPIGVKYHYRVIDIKFKSLPFKVDGTMLKNDGTLRANKSQVIIYNWGLGQLQGYLPPRAYLLGRKSIFKNDSIVNPFYKLGAVSMEESIVDDAKRAISWIRELKQSGHGWSLFPPTRPELQPNMSNRLDYPWHNAKRELAERSKDITQLWNCGSKERTLLAEDGIKKWNHPACTGKKVLGKRKRGKVLQKIIDNNQLPRFKMMPKKLSAVTKNRIKRKHSIEFFVDFETVNDVNDNFDDIRNYLPKKGETTSFEEYNGIIYMIGLGWSTTSSSDDASSSESWNYETFLVNELTYKEEERIITQWFKKMMELRGEEEFAYVYHWTHAEMTWLKRVLARGGIEECYINWYDLHKLFVETPITLHGVFDFRLKAVAKGMYKYGMIGTNWETATVDGMAAMMVAWNCYRTGEDVTKLPEMIDVIKYNEIDCKVLWEILSYLRTK